MVARIPRPVGWSKNMKTRMKTIGFWDPLKKNVQKEVETVDDPKSRIQELLMPDTSCKSENTIATIGFYA